MTDAQQQVPTAISSFVDTINAGDTEAFVALFSPDGLVDDWGTEYRGRDRVRSWAGSDAIGAGARMKVISASSEGDTTTMRFDWRSRVFNGESTGVFVVVDGLIRSFTIPPER